MGNDELYKRVNWRRVLWISGVVTVIALGVLVWLYPVIDDFREDNPSWNGATDFTAQFTATGVNSLADLPADPSGTTLVLIPYTKFSTAELEQVKLYVSGGGTLLLMDDYGCGNEVLEHMGLSVRFYGTPLLDPLFNYKNEQFPQITDFSPSPLVTGVEAIVFDHATALKDVSEAEVIAQSSHFSFVDENGNLNWDEDEPKGPLPVIATTAYGSGRVILVADPSILINSMEGMEDNAVFLRNATGSDSQVLLDQSHLPEGALTVAKEGLEETRGVLDAPLVVLGIIVVVLALTWRRVWKH